MPVFMKAGSIEGDVVAAAYRGWVEIDSCSFEVKFDEDDVRKSVGDGAPEPSLEPFEIKKSVADRSGPSFLQWMVDGTEMPTVQIDVCGDTVFGDGWRCAMRYTLKKVVLRDYTMSMTDGEKGTFTITMQLEYQELGMEQISYDKVGAERTRTRSSVHART